MSFGSYDLTQGFGANDLNFQPGAPTNIIGAGAAAPTPGATPIGQAAGSGGWFSNLFGGTGQIGGNAGSSGLLGMGQLGLSGLGTLGSLWTGMQAMNLAKQQFNFQKQFAQTNLANQTKSYDTELTDKANARYFTEGKPQSQADSYVAANKL